MKPCKLIGFLSAILVVVHLYSVKHLGQSLAVLESYGINAKKEKKAAMAAKADTKKVAANVPLEMNYSFDSMNDEAVQFEFPVVQQPAPTYIINDHSNQMC